MTDHLGADPFAWWARAAPDRVALVESRTRQQWSYRDVDVEVARWVGWLTSRGIGPGRRVAVVAGNRAEHLFLTFACGRLGALVAPLNWRLAAGELRPIVARLRPDLVVGEGEFATVLDDVAPGWLDLDADVKPAVAVASPAASVAVDPDGGWIVLFTSGTTGSPKGAILPHRQMFWNAYATALGWQLRADDIAPVTTPLFHTGGLNVAALPLWYRGGTVVLLERFDPATFRDVLEREQCTLGFAVPTQYQMLLEHGGWDRRLPHLRLLVCGGAACPPQLAQRIAAPGYAFREGFGLTEFGPNCFTGSDAALGGVSGVVGHPLPRVEARVVTEVGESAAPGEVGELYLRGPMAFAGYLDDPDRTAETLVDGWVRTGDLFAQDEDGRFVVRGRRKEMFISGGENVFPAEVEAVLAAHPAVVEVSVVGATDARWGEVGHAYLVLRGGEAAPEDVLTHARQHLAGYKVPKHVTVVDALPKLGNGKVDRAMLARGEALR